MILAIGDSNVYPACTESDQPIDSTNTVPVFADSLSRPFRCWGKNGASNYWIQTHIDYFLADQTWSPDTFLLIGWTSWEREEWPWLYNNISVCGGPDFGVPAAIKARYEQWKTTLTRDYMRACLEIWHERIYQVHEQLNECGVPHLFWTTYDNFKDLSDHKDWHGAFYRPYDSHGCMSKWFEANNIQAIAGDPFHYGVAGHQAWGTELANYAKTHLL